MQRRNPRAIANDPASSDGQLPGKVEAHADGGVVLVGAGNRQEGHQGSRRIDQPKERLLYGPACP